MARRTIVIDACCAVNLLATGREVEIADALDIAFLISDRAHAEIHCLHSPPDEEGVRHRKPASLAKLSDAGRLVVRGIDGELVDAFVACTARLRDADASCVTLAGVLRLPLLTDDAKERKVALTEFPRLELISTLELIRDAICAMGLPELEIMQIARNLRWLGNFAPPKRDALATWYLDLLHRAGVPPP